MFIHVFLINFEEKSDKMKKIFSFLCVAAFLLIAVACEKGFDQDKAEDLLRKENLSEEEFSELLDIYETGLNDVIGFSKMNHDQISQKDQEEVRVVFAIGMRLNRDMEKLTPEQCVELENINNKGKENLEIK